MNEKNLEKRCLDALIALNIEIVRYEEKTSFRQIVSVLRDTRAVLCDLHEDWLARLGTPPNIKPNVKAQWLRELADQIEENEQ